MAHSVEEVQKSIKTYMMVFASLGVLTILTVSVSYLENLSVAQAVSLALVVASVKASLVALYFMHLIDEERIIYWLLGLTVAFFVFVMYLPSAWIHDEVKVPPLWTELPVEGSATHGDHGAGHGGGHGDEHGDGHAEDTGGGGH